MLGQYRVLRRLLDQTCRCKKKQGFAGAEFPLHLDEHTIYRMAREGKIPAFKVANQWRFKNKMIEEWLQKQINTHKKEWEKR